MKRIVMTALAASLALAGRGGPGAGEEAARLRRQRRLRLLEAGRGRRQEGAGRAAATTRCQLRYPAQGTAALQNALMDDLVAAGTDAIMISSVDPKTSTDAFNRIAAQSRSSPPTATRRSRTASPISARRTPTPACRRARSPIKALPDGGKCMGFVGFLGADNAIERIAGFRKAVEGKGIELVDVRGDDVDFAQRPLQRRRRAGGQPRDHLHGRLLFLQPAEDLRGAAGGRQARRRSPSSPSTRTRSRSARSRTAPSPAPWCSSRSSGAIRA